MRPCSTENLARRTERRHRGRADAGDDGRRAGRRVAPGAGGEHGEEEVSAAEVGGDHSITASARASTEGGIVRPRALAVLRFTTSSNFVGCSTGRSAGLAPFRILST
jgi:hypothetical protein